MTSLVPYWFTKQTAETTQEVATTSHYKGEDGADDGAALDGTLVGDGVELTHHLRKSPCAE